MNELIPIQTIEERILVVRGYRVMIDADLAALYGVTRKSFNEQIRRNFNRFPSDFMFELTSHEKEQVAANCGHLSNLKFSSKNPRVFTEHGTIMLANILKNQKAIDTSIQVVRSFVRLREMMISHKDLAEKLAALEKKYDAQFKGVFDTIRKLMGPSLPKDSKIGFQSVAIEEKNRIDNGCP